MEDGKFSVRTVRKQNRMGSKTVALPCNDPNKLQDAENIQELTTAEDRIVKRRSEDDYSAKEKKYKNSKKLTLILY